MIYCPQCRKVMAYISTTVVQGAGPGQIEVYACARCRVRCNRETLFYYDADEPASALETRTGHQMQDCPGCDECTGPGESGDD